MFTLRTINKVLVVAGVLLLVIAMWANVNLYVSLANSPVDKVTWATLGFIFDVIKILMVMLVPILWAVFHRPFASLVSLLVWCLLTGLSLLTLFGYTSKVTQETERAAAIASMGYQSAQGQLTSAESKLQSLAQFASLDSAVKARYEALVAKKTQAEADLAACPRNYITNCIKPAKQRIADIEGQLATLLPQIEGYKAYQGAQSARQAALDESKASLEGGASQEALHPLFTNGPVIMQSMWGVETTPYRFKVWFLAISAILCELLASYCLWLVATLGGQNLHSVAHEEGQGMRVMVSPPQANGKAMPIGNEEVEAIAGPKT